ncbi:MAG TPA: YCF48-related protein [Ignavibacteria bacterium]
MNLIFSQENSPWKWSHPKPQGNTLRYVKVFNSTTFYAIGYAGTFIKTTNGGTNWFITHNVMGEQQNSQYFPYSGWFFDMNTGLACGTSGKISRTTNGGVSWDTISSGSTGALYGMHFINSTTGFISNYNNGILKTTNSGLNWTAVAFPSTTIYSYNIFALNENNIYAPTSSSAQLYYTTNGGTNWSIVSTGTTATLYDVCFKDVNTGWVCGSSTAVRATTNGGANWTSVNTGLSSSSFYELDYISNTLYVTGNSFYIYKSTNDGTTWDSISHTGSQVYTSTYYAFDLNATTMAAVGAFGLTNTSTNSGANWIAHNPLIYSSTLNDIWCDNMNGKVIAVGSVAPTPIMYSSNGGITWSTDPGLPIPVALNGIKMINSNTGYVCGSTNRVFKTTNGGTNWDSVSTAIGTSTTLYCPDFIDANTGWVSGSSGRIFKTTNGGSNWTLLTTGSTSTLYRIDMVDANTGWFVGSSGAVRKTTDGGTTWNAQTPNYTSTLYWIKMIDANSGYLCGLGGTVRKTTNGGTSWDTVATPFTASQYSLSFTNLNTGFVAGAAGYTIRTSNEGTTWQILNNGAATTGGIYAKGYDSAWVCASSAGILKLYNTFVGNINWSSEIPLKYTLSQNYPNPFNPKTTIKFAIPKVSRITFKIYDVVGREVETLFNNVEMNPGTVTYDFDGTNLASGVYFYTLIANDVKIDTKKMILVK